MTPIDYLRAFAEKHPAPATLIGTGIAVFAAVAVVKEWGIDPEAHIASAVYIFGSGVAVFLLAAFLLQPVAAKIGGSLIVCLIVGWLALFIGGRWPPPDRSMDCLIYFWEPCRDVRDAVAADRSKELPSLPPLQPSIAPPPDKASIPVQIRFAGFSRDRIIALAKDLTAKGWKVVDPNRGGERAASAAKMAEVRYDNLNSKTAAEALAQALNATKIIHKTITAVQKPTMTPNTLEVLIGLE
ncbi:hypothetical protein [Reyranella sp.]|uniref:hypothetical protein n=1 Tax=Reyranella sp. TaxID=1929291 RepID=UPI003D0D000A